MSLYRFKLINAFFTPVPIDHPNIPVYLAGVNTGLCRAARDVAHGFHVHRVHTVLDVDRSAMKVLKRSHPAAERICADLLRVRLPPAVVDWIDRADVVLCNPPFSEVPLALADHWLRAANMPLEWSAHIRQRAEVIFLAHNLRMLKPGGEMVMILPAAFVNGHHFQSFRAWLLDRLTVTKVVQLPINAFRSAEVRTFAIIARKDPPPPRHKIELIDFEDSVSSVHRRFLFNQQGVARLDPLFHRTGTSPAVTLVLSELGVEVSRGRPVAELRALKVPFFHTTDFGARALGAKLQFPPNRPLAGMPLAMVGDVLVGRIGRHCHTQVAVLRRGRIHFSDCVYRLQIPSQYRRAVFSSLSDTRGQSWRESRLRGSTVSLLSKAHR